ncbi:MAG: nucleotidyltransferase domain-containing protein [Acidimicrobiia bacterium]
MTSSWNPLTVEQVFDRFSPFDVDWWIAGGHAIDLFLGWQTRAHDDIDIEMFRSDRGALSSIFDGWDLHAVSVGGSVPWAPGDDLDAATFGIWGRPSPDGPWAVEIMLADGDIDQWRFRRDPAITLAGEALVRRTSAGVPYCTPEVQLLYKSKQSRPKDDVDLTRVLHKMSRVQRSWLREAIGRSDTEHPWISVLEKANEGHRE